MNTLTNFSDPALHTITPNNRLQRFLTDRVVKHAMKEVGRYAMEAPNITSLSVFIINCWETLQLNDDQFASQRRLLNEEQLFMHWVQAIRSNPVLETILSPTELAHDALSAWRKLKLWSVKTPSPESAEQRAFVLWETEFLKLKGTDVSQEEALEYIINQINKGNIELASEFCLFSFDDIPPLHQQLFDSIATRTRLFHDAFSTDKPKQAFTLRNFDKAAQLSSAANYAYQCINENPQARVAIVAPNLSQDRLAIINALNAAFEPQTVLPGIPDYTPPYNVSIGVNLAKQPIIATALQLLLMAHSESHYKELINLVTSPFIGESIEERNKRIEFDLSVRELGGASLTLIDLVTMHHCPRSLAQRFGEFYHIMHNAPQTCSLVNWIGIFENALTAIGWPGERNLTSNEYQAMNQFINALQNLSGSFSDKGDLELDSALFYIMTHIRHCTFSPETEDSPVQVLGLLEAAGLPFDHMVILDMNESVVPATPSPTCFLDVEFQVCHKMPHADASRELDFFESVMSRFSQCTQELIFSYVCVDQEREMHPSVFVKGDALATARYQQPDIDYVTSLTRQIPVKIVADHIGPVILENESPRTGVRLFQNQAICPFKATMENRLKVTEFPKPIEGLSAPKRGEILHDAMAIFWKETIDQATLLSYSPEGLAAEVSKAIAEAFLNAQTMEGIDDTLLDIEKRHMHRVMMSWMDHEKRRAPFIVVINELENTKEINIEGIPVKIRRDRKDLVIDANGRFTIGLYIDYKSGSQDLKGILAQQLRDPQLPLGVIADDKPLSIKGFAYGNMKPNQQSLIGLSDDVTISDGLKSISANKANLPIVWNEAVHYWMDSLKQTARHFLAGVADIKPSPDNCRLCTHSLACRMNNP